MWKSIFALLALAAIVVASTNSSNFTESQFSRPPLQNECRAEWRPRCAHECVQWIRDFDFEYARKSYYAKWARRRARRLAAAWMWAWH